MSSHGLCDNPSWQYSSSPGVQSRLIGPLSGLFIGLACSGAGWLAHWGGVSSLVSSAIVVLIWQIAWAVSSRCWPIRSLVGVVAVVCQLVAVVRLTDTVPAGLATLAIVTAATLAGLANTVTARPTRRAWWWAAGIAALGMAAATAIVRFVVSTQEIVYCATGVVQWLIAEPALATITVVPACFFVHEWARTRGSTVLPHAVFTLVLVVMSAATCWLYGWCIPALAH